MDGHEHVPRDDAYRRLSASRQHRRLSRVVRHAGARGGRDGSRRRQARRLRRQRAPGEDDVECGVPARLLRHAARDVTAQRRSGARPWRQPVRNATAWSRPARRFTWTRAGARLDGRCRLCARRGPQARRFGARDRHQYRWYAWRVVGYATEAGARGTAGAGAHLAKLRPERSNRWPADMAMGRGGVAALHSATRVEGEK